jgi:hypothetical protein
MIQKPPKSPSIEELYPDLSPEARQAAADNLHRYVDLVWRIYNRLKREGKLNEVMEELPKLGDKEK